MRIVRLYITTFIIFSFSIAVCEDKGIKLYNSNQFDKAKEYYENIKEEIKNKEKIKLEEAKSVIDKIKKLKITFKKEADEKDQLYGSISKKEILSFLSDENIKVLSDDIKLIEPIRTLGEHTIEINPYEGISENIKIIVKKN